MGVLEAVKSYFINWKNFQSRSSRSEYWWGTLFVMLGFPVATVVIGFFVGFTYESAGFSEDAMELILGIVILSLQVFVVISSTALVVRRLHDVDKSGWWYLLIFTVVGLLPLLIWYCTKGTEGKNRFGKDPLVN